MATRGARGGLPPARPSRIPPLLDLLFPPRCELCRTLLPGGVGFLCEPCLAGIALAPAHRCLRCGEFLDPLAHSERCGECRRRRRDPLAAARAAAPHLGGARTLVHRLKYQRRRQAAPALGAVLERWLADDAEAAAALALDRCDAIVPVPLHPWRRWRRGFNQADLLAAELAPRLGLPVAPALRRTRATRPQVGLDPEARRRNVAGAFSAVAGQVESGASYLLLDDVYTTGATLRECARMLRSAGAERVVAVTVARAVGDPERWGGGR